VKAVVHDEYGEPEAVLRLAEVSRPEVDDYEVLVRVRAAGVNWADWAITRGVPYLIRLPYGLRRPRHGIRGSDVSGEVEAVGREVTRHRPGDEVFGWCGGAFAELVCVDEDHLVAKPPGIGFEQAAAAPMAGMVALQALRNIGKIRPGQKVLVNGASGGIGTFTVQIAKALGAHVTGVCSTPNVDLVRSLGADRVIDYTQEDFTRGDERYDFILDMADTHSLAARRRVLRKRGVLIPNSGVGGRWIGSVGRVVRARLASLVTRRRLRPFVSVSKTADLATLQELLAAGKVTPVVGVTYPLEETAAALAHVGAGHTRGKVVVTP
jgi:NADPH:quinone reductase-like Zn-dependent oxidoreductase